MGEAQGKGGSSTGSSVPARRLSPRVIITRPIVIECAHWEAYKEVETVNISRSALLLRGVEDPPDVGDQLKVWISIRETEGRRWTPAQVVRHHPDLDADGPVGIVIQLSEPDVDAIDCLVPEGVFDFPMPDGHSVDGEFTPYDDGTGTGAPVPMSVEIDLEGAADTSWQETKAHKTKNAVQPPPLPGASGRNRPALEDMTPFEGDPLPNIKSSQTTATGVHPPEGRTTPEVYLPPPPASIIKAEIDLDPFSSEEANRNVSSTPETTEREPSGPVEPPPSEDREIDTDIEDIEEPKKRKGTAGAYTFRPEQAIDDVGGAIGFTKGLAPVDTVVSATIPMPSPSPSPSPFSPPPQRLLGSDTLVSAPPVEAIEAEDEETDEDTLEHRSSRRLPQSDSGERAIPPPEIIMSYESARTPAPSQTEETASPIPDFEVGPPLRSPKRQLDDSPPPSAKRQLRDASDVKQISARSGWAEEGIPAVLGRAEAPAVGIDFGTTYCKVAVCADKEVILIEDLSSTSASRASVPSIVGWPAPGRHLVGEHARDMLATDPAHVIYSVKRVMGLLRSDPLANGLLGSLACPTAAGPNDSILFDLHGQQITVPEVASLLLEHLRKMVSRYVNADVRKAVFTFPVDFDQKAKRELELAARMAGLQVIGMVAEPVAAAMGCGHGGSGDQSVIVYDFGGGTFDVSVVDVGHQRFTVRGSAGDRWLGGDDFDEILARHVADEFQQETKISLHNRAEEWQRLLFACEEAKRWLTSLDSVDVVLPNAAVTKKGPLTLLTPINRPSFNELSADIITSTLETCLHACLEAGLKPKEVDALLVTGGTTRIPAVRKAAEHFFNQSAAEGIHPQHAVVIGAAVRAAVLSGTQVPDDFADRLKSHGAAGRDVGLALAGGTTERIIDSSERLPTVAHRQYSTHRDGQTTIRLELVEGSSTRTDQNRRIGGFVIEGLPARRAGGITLDVYFELSSTGTLYVTAQERNTGLRAQGTFEIME